MKYFKIDEPYLALIKANSIGEALSRYSVEIAEKETDNYVCRLSKLEALGMFIDAVIKTEPEASIMSIIKDFDDPNNYILLVEDNLT